MLICPFFLHRPSLCTACLRSTWLKPSPTPWFGVTLASVPPRALPFLPCAVAVLFNPPTLSSLPCIAHLPSPAPLQDSLPLSAPQLPSPVQLLPLPWGSLCSVAPGCRCPVRAPRSPGAEPHSLSFCALVCPCAWRPLGSQKGAVHSQSPSHLAQPHHSHPASLPVSVVNPRPLIL